MLSGLSINANSTCRQVGGSRGCALPSAAALASSSARRAVIKRWSLDSKVAADSSLDRVLACLHPRSVPVRIQRRERLVPVSVSTWSTSFQASGRPGPGCRPTRAAGQLRPAGGNRATRAQLSGHSGPGRLEPGFQVITGRAPGGSCPSDITSAEQAPTPRRVNGVRCAKTSHSISLA